jgi:hypothetical protein
MKNINDGNVQAFPYWPRTGIQNQFIIPGHILAGEVSDIAINRIPWETDFNNGDIRTIPFPGSPAQQVTDSIKIINHLTPLGHGQSANLMDLLVNSIIQTNTAGKG